MKLLKFTFRNEAIWMMVLSLAPIAIGFLLILIVWLLRTVR